MPKVNRLKVSYKLTMVVFQILLQTNLFVKSSMFVCPYSLILSLILTFKYSIIIVVHELLVNKAIMLNSK